MNNDNNNQNNNPNEGLSFTDLYGVTSTDTQPAQPVQPTPEPISGPEPSPEVQPESSPVVKPETEFDTTVKIEEPEKINIMDSEYIKAFVGEKYDSFVNNPFNIGAFFFGNLYFFYRKMFAYGIVLFIITLAIGSITKIMGLGLLVNVLCAFIANKMYLNFAAKKVKSLSMLYSDMELMERCSAQGGTSVGLVFAGMATELVCSIIIMIIGIVVLGVSLFGSLVNPNNWEITVNDESDVSGDNSFDTNTWLQYDTEFRLADEYVYSKPAGLEGNDYPKDGEPDNGQFNYTYKNGNFDECNFTMGRVSGKTSAKVFSENYAKVINGVVGTKTFNGIKWYTVTSSNTDAMYFTEKDHKVYSFHYLDYSGEGDKCPKYRDQILNSIKEK